MRILFGILILIAVAICTTAAIIFCVEHFSELTVIPIVIIGLIGAMFGVFIMTTISCPNCSHWVYSNYAYCEECGYAINPECEKCHNTITSGEYCNKCGEKVKH